MSAKKYNIKLQMIANNEICILNDDVKIEKPDFVIFLDKDINLARKLEKSGFKVYNSAKSIEICDDKAYTSEFLDDLPMPKTIIAPLNFKPYIDSEYNEKIFKTLGFPIVIKESFGSFGEQVYLAENISQFLEIQSKVQLKPHIYQEFIENSSGRDVRIYVAFEKVVLSVLRTNEDDFRANVSTGGNMKLFAPEKSFLELAIKATKKISASFAGVDILFGENNQPILCEINTNAHIKNAFDLTGVNVADFIFEGIINEIRNTNL